ncbi:alcohol dehydrogenase catalytic domain-containing protein [Glutamicibacter soli]
MLTATTTAKRCIEYREVPAPAPAPGRALVRVRHVALCGTDAHIWDDDYPAELPVIQGHEFTGIIEQIDPGAVDPRSGLPLVPGLEVAVSPMVYCSHCPPCLDGRYNVCESISCLGCYEDGALAEVVSVPVDKLHPLPQGLPLHLGALGEPGSIAMQAVNRGTPVPGETALVLGCGPIGLLATLFLAERGVRVIASDLSRARMDLARDFGAVAAFAPGGGIPREAWGAAAGPTLVIEATGVPASFETAVRLAAPTARLVQVGISTRHASLSLRDIPFKELDIRGSRNSLNLIPDALDVLARHQQQATRLVTHRFAFDSLGQAFETMRDSSQAVGKIVIDLPVTGAGIPPQAGTARLERSTAR